MYVCVCDSIADYTFGDFVAIISLLANEYFARPLFNKLKRCAVGNVAATIAAASICCIMTVITKNFLNL